MPFNMWLPPTPHLILPKDSPAIVRPATPNLRPPSILGLTMMARTWALRSKPAQQAGGISLVGVFENSSNGSGTTTVTLSGAAAGDVAYSFQCAGVTSGAATGPTGYTGLGSIGVISSGSKWLVVARKILSGADASAVFPATGIGAFFGTACGIVLLRGVNNTTPEDATMTTTADQTSGQPDGPAITTVTANAWVISAFGSDSSSASFMEPAGYGNKIDIFGDGFSSDGAIGVAMINAGAAGSKNPGAWSGVTSGGWGAATLAIRPA